jgi:hypothetical protein
VQFACHIAFGMLVSVCFSRARPEWRQHDPLTVDVSDRVSLYGGFSASASQSGISDWSNFTVTSWNVGFQAQVYK